MVSVWCWCGDPGTTMGAVLGASRLVATSVNSTATPCTVAAQDQEMFREPSPFPVAARPVGGEGESAVH